MNRYLDLLKRYSSTEESFDVVSRHSFEVLSKAIDIIAKKNLRDRIDFDLVVSGCLLHDIGSFGFLENKDMEGYIRHGVIGAEILEREGLEKEAAIAKRHTGAGLSKKDILAAGWPLPPEDLLPLTLEERLVCYADKFSSKLPGKKDTLETIEKEFEGYGPESLARFRALKEEFE